MNGIRTLGAVLVAVFALSANGAVAATGPTVEPAARSLLRAATDYLEKQPALSFAAQIVSDDVVPSGLKYKIRATAQFDVQRPGKLFVDYSGDRRRAKFYSDGLKFVLYDEAANVYGTAAATNNNDSTLATIFTKYDFTVPLLDILSNHPNNALAGKIIRGYDLGASSVNGTATRHLLFTQREIDWEIWIDTGTTPLIRAFSITYKQLPGQPEYSSGPAAASAASTGVASAVISAAKVPHRVHPRSVAHRAARRPRIRPNAKARWGRTSRIGNRHLRRTSTARRPPARTT
jgi:hypothetical protein